MLLNITTLSGCLPPVELPADATTNDLKRRIYEVCPESASKRLRVMKSDHVNTEVGDEFIELNVDTALSAYDVTDGSQLSVVFDEYRFFERTDIDGLLTKYHGITDANEAASLICQDFSENFCQHIGALDLSDLIGKVGRDSGFFAGEFCADMAEALSSTVHSISTLNMSRNSLYPSTCRKIEQCISSSPSITELNLSETQLTGEAAAVIASIIESDSSIRILNVSGNSFWHPDIAVIAAALVKNHSITDVDVSNSDVTDRIFRLPEPDILPDALSAMIKSNSIITRLNLSSIFMSDDCVKQMAAAIQTNQSITELDISHNRVAQRGLAALTSMISVNSSIVKLQMRYVFDRSFQSQDSNSELFNNFFGAFTVNSTITDLAIDIVGMSVEGVRAVSSMLKSNTSIVKLDIRHLFSEERHLIFNAFSQNRSLTELTLCIDGMGDIESQSKLSMALSNMIRFNSTIVKLDLSQSDFDNESLVISIAVALTHNTCIQELNLNACRINTAGGAALANMLSFNKTILKLHPELESNRTGRSAADRHGVAKQLHSSRGRARIAPESSITGSRSEFSLVSCSCRNDSLPHLHYSLGHCKFWWGIRRL